MVDTAPEPPEPGPWTLCSKALNPDKHGPPVCARHFSTRPAIAWYDGPSLYTSLPWWLPLVSDLPGCGIPDFRIHAVPAATGMEWRSAGMTSAVVTLNLHCMMSSLSDACDQSAMHTISPFDPHVFVFVDESGCDKRIGFRRTGWSPLGVTVVIRSRHLLKVSAYWCLLVPTGAYWWL
jgi:hypothetical protein